TGRKKAEQKLIESENELRQSQEIAQLGTYNFNISTQVFFSSPIFDSIVGFKAGDKKTLETYKEIVHPDDFVLNEEMLKECIKTSKKFDREYRIFNYSTKELIWLHGFGEIIFGEKDEMHFKGTIQDITERKLIELQIKLNERKLKEVQKIANLGTYEIDLKTNNIITSELYSTIFGIKKKPTNNKGWWKSITHSDDFEQSELLWQQCIKDCKTYNDEYRILTENNEIRWIHDIAEVKGKNGLATKVVGTVQDITERKSFEEQIKRSDNILNQIDSLVVVNNAKGDIVYISPSVKSILGYEPSLMLGRGWWRLTYAEDKLGENRIKEIFDQFIGENSKTHATSIRRIKTNDGNYKLIEWHISKASDDTFISIGIDITEKKEQEEQFKTLTETAHDAIILVDHNGSIFEWNRSSEETFGYSKQEIEGKSITSLMPEKYRLQYEKGFSDVMQKGLKESYRNNIVEGLTKEGVVFPMELSLNYWESNNNYVYCYFVRDITQRERDEKITELIFNITNKSNEVLDLKKFFHYIKIELEKLINTDNFFIALYDEKTEMISTPYMVDEIDIASDFPKGKTLTGHVIDTKSALLTKGIILDPKSEDPKPIGLGPESKCWLGVPMLVENKAIGAIVVQSYTDENAYTQNDVAFLELVASNIGQAVKKTEDLMQIRLLNKALIQSPQAVIITNIKGDIEYINPAFTELSGYTEADVIGKNPRILKSSKHLPEYYKNLWQTISKGKTWDGEFVNRHKDGSSYLVEANISSVKNENGRITHYIGVQEDITEKRKLERQFINTFIDAQEVEKQNFGEELHDSISQILSAEGMYINLLIEQNQDRINDKAKFLTKIKELNTNAVNETRNIAHGLMSSQLKQSGLLIAVENICIDF
ncbi:MAG: PAS domain S-box protein, partial [Aureibaculum sp.]|nr:PAS domain S-box protein [Aureibaculum sp.]